MESTLINTGLVITYILLVIAIVTALAFPIIQSVGNLKAAKGALIGVGLIVVVFLLSYLLSPADTGPFYEKFNISPKMSKLIGGSLIATYLFFIAAAVSIIYASATKFFR